MKFSFLTLITILSISANASEFVNCSLIKNKKEIVKLSQIDISKDFFMQSSSAAHADKTEAELWLDSSVQKDSIKLSVLDAQLKPINGNSIVVKKELLESLTKGSSMKIKLDENLARTYEVVCTNNKEEASPKEMRRSIDLACADNVVQTRLPKKDNNIANEQLIQAINETR